MALENMDPLIPSFATIDYFDTKPPPPDLSSYLTSAQIETEISTSTPIGQKGQLIFNQETGTRKGSQEWLVLEGNFTTTSAELTNALAGGVSSVDAFNNWYRFSHKSGVANQPAIPAELAAWNYDATNDEINCTINSSSYIGFASTKKVDNYLLDVKMVSTQRDNDRMGIVIAFHVDSAGLEHTLTVTRNNDNDTNTWRIAYNYGVPGYYVVKDKSSAITRGGNWNQYPEGTRIKVRRTGDIITCTSTQNNSSVFVPESEMVINLASDSRLDKFRGIQSYGYMCQSQGGATFSDIKFIEYGPNAIQNYVFDMNQDKVYLPKTDGSYSLAVGKTLQSEVGPGKLIRDKNSKSTWYTSPSGSVEVIVESDLNKKDYIKYQGTIPANADLNNYTISGDWLQNRNTNASTGKNYPTPYAGYLASRSSLGMVYQTYHRYASSDIYSRSYYNTWTPWKKNNIEISLTTAKITSNYTMKPNMRILADIRSNSIVVKLPTSPNSNDSVEIIDLYRKAGTNKIVIDRNGKTIHGSAENDEISFDGGSVKYRYLVSTWVVVP